MFGQLDLRSFFERWEGQFSLSANDYLWNSLTALHGLELPDFIDIAFGQTYIHMYRARALTMMLVPHLGWCPFSVPYPSAQWFGIEWNGFANLHWIRRTPLHAYAVELVCEIFQWVIKNEYNSYYPNPRITKLLDDYNDCLMYLFDGLDESHKQQILDNFSLQRFSTQTFEPYHKSQKDHWVGNSFKEAVERMMDQALLQNADAQQEYIRFSFSHILPHDGKIARRAEFMRMMGKLRKVMSQLDISSYTVLLDACNSVKEFLVQHRRAYRTHYAQADSWWYLLDLVHSAIMDDKWRLISPEPAIQWPELVTSFQIIYQSSAGVRDRISADAEVAHQILRRKQKNLPRILRQMKFP